MILMYSQVSEHCQIHPLLRLWFYGKYHIINPVCYRFLYIVFPFIFSFSFQSQRVRGCLSTSELAFRIRFRGLHSWPCSSWKWISSSWPLWRHPFWTVKRMRPPNPCWCSTLLKPLSRVMWLTWGITPDQCPHSPGKISVTCRLPISHQTAAILKGDIMR